MSKTVTVPNFPITHHMDLAEYFSQVPHHRMQFNLIKMLINDADFLVRSAVSAAVKYLREEALELNGMETFSEIADAVSGMQLAELSFFEAGNNRPSMLETIQHLAELRPHWIELAQSAYALVEGERSTLSSLMWSQPTKRDKFNPESIEEQFENPTFNVSKTKRERARQITIKTHRKMQRPDTELEKRLAACDDRLEQDAISGEAKFKAMAPLNIAVYHQMLRAPTQAMRETETVGLNHSTDGDGSNRRVHTGSRTFESLPVQIRYTLYAKAMENVQKWREWQINARMSDEEWAIVDCLCDQVYEDLERLLSSPAMKAAMATVED